MEETSTETPNTTESTFTLNELATLVQLMTQATVPVGQAAEALVLLGKLQQMQKKAEMEQPHI